MEASAEARPRPIIGFSSAARDSLRRADIGGRGGIGSREMLARRGAGIAAPLPFTLLVTFAFGAIGAAVARGVLDGEGDDGDGAVRVGLLRREDVRCAIGGRWR